MLTQQLDAKQPVSLSSRVPETEAASPGTGCCGLPSLICSWATVLCVVLVELRFIKREVSRFKENNSEVHSQGCVAITSSSKACHPPRGPCAIKRSLPWCASSAGHPLSDDGAPALGVYVKGVLHCDLRGRLLSPNVMFSRCTRVREHAIPSRGGTVTRAAVDVRVHVGAPAFISGSCSVLC